MDIAYLARRRAEACARVEALAGLGTGGDPEENREMAIATSKAMLDYRAAEMEFQKAAGLLTVEELAAAGVTA